MTKSRKGFSLIEVMVAMTMLAIVLMSLARMSLMVSLRGRDNDLFAKRTAVLQLEANKLGAIPYSTLASWSTTTTTLTLGDFTYKRRMAIANTGTNRYSIKVIIIPMSDTTKQDSVTLDRTKPATNTPLCLTC
jgi:prepilin-type N-terminal cleavage/methylation domain-containing protein